MPFPVWLLIAGAFFYFAGIFWVYSKTPYRQFVVRFKADEENPDEVDLERSALAEEIQSDIDGFIQSTNEIIQTRYRIGAIGFIIAGLTAIISIFLG